MSENIDQGQQEMLAKRMAQSLGLPLSNIQLLIPHISPDEQTRLMGIPDDEDLFLRESAKVISAAQQAQFQSMSSGAATPAAEAATTAVPETKAAPTSQAKEAKPASDNTVKPLTLGNMQSLDRTKAKQQGFWSGLSKKQQTMLIAGVGMGFLLFLGIAMVFFWMLLRSAPADKEEAKPLIARHPVKHKKPQKIVPNKTANKEATKETSKEVTKGADNEKEPQKPAKTPPNSDGQKVPEEIAFPPALLAQISTKFGKEKAEQAQAEWQQRSREQRIAFLAGIGLWKGKIPEKAQKIIEATRKRLAKRAAQKAAAMAATATTPTVESAPKLGLVDATEKKKFRHLYQLIKKNPDKINETGKNGQTALHVAARIDNEKVVRMLLHFKADVNARDHDGKTPLHYAAMSGAKAIRVVALLLKTGAKVDAEDNLKATPLSLAASFGNTAVVKLLLAKNANPAHPDLYGAQALHNAATVDIARELIKKGANVNATTKLQVTPLHQAAARGRTRIAAFLIKKGAHINAEDLKHHTPLYYAVRNSQRQMVEMLLKAKADPNIEAKYGVKTPLTLAREMNSPFFIELLRANGAK